MSHRAPTEPGPRQRQRGAETEPAPRPKGRGLTPSQLLDLHQSVTNTARNIMEAKNHDYRGGSGDCFANFRDSAGLGIHPIMGILMRMRDKQQRIRAFVEKGELKVQGEGVADAIIDQINYLVLIYGILVEDGALGS